MTQTTLPDLAAPEPVGGGEVQGGATRGPVIAGRTPTQLAVARLRRDKVAIISGVVIVILILIAIFAPFVAKLDGHPPNLQYRRGTYPALDLSGIPVGPNSHYLLGADINGRDMLSRLAYGARISLFIGIVATALSMLIGVVFGLVAGFYGGWIDTLMSRIIDIFLSFPIILFAVSLVSVYGNSVFLLMVIIVTFGWTTFARITRGQVLSLREKEFVEAARGLGSGDMRIMFIDMLPNLVAPLIVYGTLTIPTNIVTEATLSFLGLGVQIPTSSWGELLADAQSYYILRPTLLIFPILALLITTLAFNLFGDGVRDAFDPRAARTMAK